MISSGRIPTRTVLGVPIAALRLKEIPNVIVKLIEEGARYKTASGKASHKTASGKAMYKTASGKARYRLVPGKKTFFYVNAHCFNIAGKDPVYKKILQRATLVYADGMGPILASRILGQSLPERTPAIDFINEVFSVGEQKKWSFYLFGGEENVIKTSSEILRKKFPKLKITGYHHGFFSNNGDIIEKINRAKPDIILVGMGTPRQEKWIADNIDKVNTNAFWAVGGLFDFLSGRRKRSPKWMQRIGLEWVFRLLQEPRRLWRRYLFGNIRFLLTVLQEKEFFSRKSNH